ncbi:RNA polymerase sigma factor [Pelagibacterium luteolum]|uniref:RNA polymerase sigma-70 factor, ECF subfamily n=1 Tax=Pelagibacterium luteolum TaxID=440168 RepID=A0A1G7SE60_9HYPH|nr:sigma factor [Pelagibacterium luteolum]SDG21273.1 RNA polymerase sigma-70 factor, ECF subfamily [Pelagibacterium luteolum]
MHQQAAYRHLVGVAKRYARRGDEAEDIVQEVLIAAVVAGREDGRVAANRRWMEGAIRKRAAFDARSAVRRRQRESRWQDARDGGEAGASGDDLQTILADLPKSLRVVAALALSGHGRSEIAYLLDLTDAALRQRIRALKLALRRKGIEMPGETIGLNLDLAYGAIREALVPALRRHGGMFATHDPDGHLLILTRSHMP